MPEDRAEQRRQNQLLDLKDWVLDAEDRVLHEIALMERLMSHRDVYYPPLVDVLDDQDFEVNAGEGVSWRAAGATRYEYPHNVAYRAYVRRKFDRYQAMIDGLFQEYDPAVVEQVRYSVLYYFGTEAKKKKAAGERDPFTFSLRKRNNENIVAVFDRLPTSRSPALIFKVLSVYAYPLSAAFNEMVPIEGRDDAGNPIYPGRKYVPWVFNRQELTEYMQAFGRFLAYCELPISYAPAKFLIGRFTPAEVDRLLEIKSILHGEAVARQHAGQSVAEPMQDASGASFAPMERTDAEVGPPGYEKVTQEAKERLYKPAFDLEFLLDPARWRHSAFAFLISDRQYETLAFKFARQAANAIRRGILPISGEHWSRVVNLFNRFEAFLPPRPIEPAAAERYGAWQALALLMLYILPDHDYAYSVFFREYFRFKEELAAEIQGRVKRILADRMAKDADSAHLEEVRADVARLKARDDLDTAAYLLETYYNDSYQAVNSVILDVFGFFYQESVRPFTTVLREAGILPAWKAAEAHDLIDTLFTAKYGAGEHSERAITSSFDAFIFGAMPTHNKLVEEEIAIPEKFIDADGNQATSHASETMLLQRLVRLSEDEYAAAQSQAGLRSRYMQIRKMKDITPEAWDAAVRHVVDEFRALGVTVKNPEADPAYGDRVLTAFAIKPQLTFDENLALQRMGRRIYTFSRSLKRDYWYILREGAGLVSFTMDRFPKAVMEQAMRASSEAVAGVEDGAAEEDYDDAEGQAYSEAPGQDDAEDLPEEERARRKRELDYEIVWEDGRYVKYIFGRRTRPAARSGEIEEDTGPRGWPERLDVLNRSEQPVFAVPTFLNRYRTETGNALFADMPYFKANPEYSGQPLGQRYVVSDPGRAAELRDQLARTPAEAQGPLLEELNGLLRERWKTDAAVPLPSMPGTFIHMMNLLERDQNAEYLALYEYLSRAAQPRRKREMDASEYLLTLFDMFRRRELLPSSGWRYMTEHAFTNWITMGRMTLKLFREIDVADEFVIRDLTRQEAEGRGLTDAQIEWRRAATERLDLRRLILKAAYEGPAPSLMDYLSVVPEAEQGHYMVIFFHRERVSELMRAYELRTGEKLEPLEAVGQTILALMREMVARQERARAFEADMADLEAQRDALPVEYGMVFLGEGRGTHERLVIRPEPGKNEIKVMVDGEERTYRLRPTTVTVQTGDRTQSYSQGYWYKNENGQLVGGPELVIYGQKEGGGWAIRRHVAAWYTNNRWEDRKRRRQFVETRAAPVVDEHDTARGRYIDAVLHLAADLFAFLREPGQAEADYTAARFKFVWGGGTAGMGAGYKMLDLALHRAEKALASEMGNLEAVRAVTALLDRYLRHKYGLAEVEKAIAGSPHWQVARDFIAAEHGARLAAEARALRLWKARQRFTRIHAKQARKRAKKAYLERHRGRTVPLWMARARRTVTEARKKGLISAQGAR